MKWSPDTAFASIVFCEKPLGRNAADRHLGLGEPLGTVGMEGPAAELCFRRSQRLIGQIGEITGKREPLR